MGLFGSGQRWFLVKGEMSWALKRGETAGKWHFRQSEATRKASFNSPHFYTEYCSLISCSQGPTVFLDHMSLSLLETKTGICSEHGLIQCGQLPHAHGEGTIIAQKLEQIW